MCSLSLSLKKTVPDQTAYLQVKHSIQCKRKQESLFVVIQLLQPGQSSFFKPEHPIVPVLAFIVTLRVGRGFLFHQGLDPRNRRWLILLGSLRVAQIDKDRLALEEHIPLNDRAFECLLSLSLKMGSLPFRWTVSSGCLDAPRARHCQRLVPRIPWEKGQQVRVVLDRRREEAINEMRFSGKDQRTQRRG